MSLSPPTNPLHAVSVTETTLPVSGLRLVLTERGPRQTLEIDDADGELLSVISDSLLDPAVLRGSWRGVRDGQPWALVVGRSSVRGSVSEPVAVTFTGTPGKLRHLPGHKGETLEVIPQWIGDFWLAEAPTRSARASVTVDGVPAGTSALEQVA